MKMTQGGFSIIRKAFGALSVSQVDETNFLVDEFDKDKSISYPQAAYMLATTWHETDKKMLPIEEYGKGKGRPYGTWYKNSKGEEYSFTNFTKTKAYLKSDFPFLYYGMGYVQLTWKDNIDLASRKIGVDFTNNPKLVMERKHAVKILITGMKEGWFTGRKLSDYINQSKTDYVNARRIINGTDKANLIAGYADTFEKALRAW